MAPCGPKSELCCWDLGWGRMLQEDPCSRMSAQPWRAAAPLPPAACAPLASHPLSARKHKSTVCLCNTFCKAFFLPIWETAVGFMAGRVYSAFTAGGGAGRECGAGRRLRARSGDVAPACCSCIPTSTASPTPKAPFPPSGAAPQLFSIPP